MNRTALLRWPSVADRLEVWLVGSGGIPVPAGGDRGGGALYLGYGLPTCFVFAWRQALAVSRDGAPTP